MAHTIRSFQGDKAVLLAEKIENKTGEFIEASRIETVLQTYGVVSDYTYWRRLPNVLEALGFDYDEIEEVAP